MYYLYLQIYNPLIEHFAEGIFGVYVEQINWPVLDQKRDFYFLLIALKNWLTVMFFTYESYPFTKYIILNPVDK